MSTEVKTISAGGTGTTKSMLPRRVVMISGTTDEMTTEEWTKYYGDPIDALVTAGCTFVVGGADGVDKRAQLHLANSHPLIQVTVYDKGTQCNVYGQRFKHVNGFSSYPERDAAMTAASTEDLLVISQYGGTASGTFANLLRRFLLGTKQDVRDSVSAADKSKQFVDLVRKHSMPYNKVIKALVREQEIAESSMSGFDWTSLIKMYNAKESWHASLEETIARAIASELSERQDIAYDKTIENKVVEDLKVLEEYNKRFQDPSLRCPNKCRIYNNQQIAVMDTDLPMDATVDVAKKKLAGREFAQAFPVYPDPSFRTYKFNVFITHPDEKTRTCRWRMIIAWTSHEMDDTKMDLGQKQDDPVAEAERIRRIKNLMQSEKPYGEEIIGQANTM